MTRGWAVVPTSGGQRCAVLGDGLPELAGGLLAGQCIGQGADRAVEIEEQMPGPGKDGVQSWYRRHGLVYARLSASGMAWGVCSQMGVIPPFFRLTGARGAPTVTNWALPSGVDAEPGGEGAQVLVGAGFGVGDGADGLADHGVIAGLLGCDAAS